MERDRPWWGVTNDAVVRLPDHAPDRAIRTNACSVFVRTTRPAMSIRTLTWTHQLVASARAGYGHNVAPDELLVDLISETTERICGFKPEPELVKQFLARGAHAPNDALDGSSSLVLSRETNPPSAQRTRREGQGPTLPITLDPQNSADFLDALLRTKEAWLEVSYSDGRKDVRRWDASLMSTSSNVIGNLRSRPEFRNRAWQNNGIASLRVSVEHPRSKDA